MRCWWAGGPFAAIRSLTVALMVFATALLPVLFGALIDAGVGLDVVMLAAALYVFIASALMALSYPLPTVIRLLRK